MAVCSFMQTRTCGSRTWPTYPLALARMWNQVGKPSMFEGNTFLPLHGIPIAYKARKMTRLADWLPEPLTVPTRIARSLIVGANVACPARAGASSTTDKAGWHDVPRNEGGNAPHSTRRTGDPSRR